MRQADHQPKKQTAVAARFDPLVHHACACDDNSVHEVALTVTTALNARVQAQIVPPSAIKSLMSLASGSSGLN